MGRHANDHDLRFTSKPFFFRRVFLNLKMIVFGAWANPAQSCHTIESPGSCRMDARWDPHSRSDVVGNAARPMTKTPRILIVDDEADLAEELRETLEDAGFNVISTASATEAFAMVRNDHGITIVVVDLLMPDLHGLEFVEKVRLLERGHAIRFIAMTGQATVEDVIKAMRLGISEFIRKPVSGEEIVSVITELAQQDAQRDTDGGGQSSSAPGGDDAQDPDRKSLLDRLIRLRRDKAKIFAGDLVADPVWDMLLALARDDLDGKGVPSLNLAIDGGIPAASALRRISEMEAAGLIIRRSDHQDRRRILVYLTDAGREAVARYLDSFPHLLLDRAKNQRLGVF